jgi:hypothetical protein
MMFGVVVAALTSLILGITLKFAGYAYVPDKSPAYFMLNALARVFLSLVPLFAGIVVYLYGYHLYAFLVLASAIVAIALAVVRLTKQAERVEEVPPPGPSL